MHEELNPITRLQPKISRIGFGMVAWPLTVIADSIFFLHYILTNVISPGKRALSCCSGVSLFNVESFLRTEMGVIMRICVGRFPYPLAAVGPCFSL